MFAAAGQAASDGCAGASAVPVDAAGRAQAARAVVCLVNRERTGRGLRALRLSGPLSAAARSHSADMVARGYFAHDSPAGDTLASRVQRSGYAAAHPRFDVGEALAWGQQVSPDALVAALMRSAIHRHVLLDEGGRYLGIGLLLGAPAGGVPAPSVTLVLDVGA
ncbi:MAG TPA: CAP domain-containing protein [Solirubrobacteraceae bacterium]|nr:CAP domain-containing protein [Solirubrobacteraceae bacterium]